MGDSAAMSIEFLRARLLSERAISRAAKERADQLAKKVVELEEQLSFVIAWRKEAEKEATQALSILEAYGMDDLFEVTDSSTETDEIPNNAKGGGEIFDGDEATVASKTNMNGAEDANSSSEHGGSTLEAGRLSWKSCSTNLESQRKLKAKQLKQLQRILNLISCVEFSPKYILGKSCRKIKQMEMGSSTEDKGENSISPDACEHGEMDRSHCVDDQPDLSVQASGHKTCDVENKEAYGGHYGSTRDEDMERLLEQQAQLIGQYEAEEKAQREWEEKYNANKSPNVDYSVQGNQCHVAENNFEQQKQSSLILSMILYEDEEAKMTNKAYLDTNEQVAGSLFDEDHVVNKLYQKEMTDGSQNLNPLTNGIVPIVLPKTSSGSDPLAYMDDLMHQAQSMMANITENALNSEGRKNPSVLYDNLDSGSSNYVTSNLHGHINFNLTSIVKAPTSDFIRDNSRLGSLKTQDQHQLLVSQTANSSLEGVLEALQHAKGILQKELQKSHLFCRSNLILGTTTDYQAGSTVYDETLRVPVGSAGLFRLPSDATELGRISEHMMINTTVAYPELGRATTTKHIGYASTLYTDDAGSSDIVRNVNSSTHSSTYNSGMSLPGSRRYPLAYSDVTKEQIPFSYGSNDSNKQCFLTNSQCTGILAPARNLPSDLRTFGNLLDGYGISDLNKDSYNIQLGLGMPAVNRYSFPHSELT